MSYFGQNSCEAQQQELTAAQSAQGQAALNANNDGGAALFAANQRMQTAVKALQDCQSAPPASSAVSIPISILSVSSDPSNCTPGMASEQDRKICGEPPPNCGIRSRSWRTVCCPETGRWVSGNYNMIPAEAICQMAQNKIPLISSNSGNPVSKLDKKLILVAGLAVALLLVYIVKA